MKILVTGGAGFIGANLVRHLLDSRRNVEIANLDALTYAGNLESLEGLEEEPHYRFVPGDICDAGLVRGLVQEVDAVVNLAAESHVDRSIEDVHPFLRTNVVGVQTLLDAIRDAERAIRLLHVSTDEVYGSLEWRDPREAGPDDDARRFTETTPVAPRSPYAASKAAADHLVMAYHHTHGVDAVVTRSSNNYGPFQFPEKLIPLAATNVLEGEPVPIYGDGLNVRDWVHVRDHCLGLELALYDGRAGEVYNFGGGAERTNLQVVRAILRELGADDEMIEFVSDRPGHDRRYAIDYAKARDDLGWRPTRSFREGLRETVRWYRENPDWWRRVKSGEYRTYYERMYGAGGPYEVGGPGEAPPGGPGGWPGG